MPTVPTRWTPRQIRGAFSGSSNDYNLPRLSWVKLRSLRTWPPVKLELLAQILLRPFGELSLAALAAKAVCVAVVFSARRTFFDCHRQACQIIIITAHAARSRGV